jgi:rubrerythrin
MRETFAFGDVLNTLIRLEEKGFRAYSKGGEAATDETLRALLKNLAAAEQRHQELFEGLKEHEAALVGATPEDADPDYQEYLEVLLDSHIAVPTIAEDTANASAILRQAFALEKETILFLDEAERSVVSEGIRDKLRRVADEERGHIRAISKTAKELGIALATT